MKHFRISSLLLLLLMTMFACTGNEPQLRKLSSDAVVLAFGDSLTYGTGTTTDQSYPSVLQKLTGRPVINAGVPGEITRDGLARLAGVLDTKKPDLVILIHGGNDMIRRLGMAQAADNLRRMIGLARERQIDVVLLGVPNPSILLSTAPFYAEIAQETATPLLADALADILQYPANKSDLIHPNARGYRLLAEAIRDLLIDRGAL